MRTGFVHGNGHRERGLCKHTNFSGNEKSRHFKLYIMQNAPKKCHNKIHSKENLL